VLRVDELRKLGGTPCPELHAESGCSIHETRPGICRAYRCLWLRGGLEEADRPDRLGAVVDLLQKGMGTRLSIQEAEAASYRESMPVRIVEPGRVLDADRPFRVLLAQGEEQRVEGESVEIFRGGRRIGQRRIPWLEARVRKIAVIIRGWRLRDYR